MNDNIKKPVEGYFKLEVYKHGILVDTYEDHNKIMMFSKRVMAHSMGGAEMNNGLAVDDEPKYISTFALGTDGHQAGNLLAAKSFEYTQTKMFSEDLGLGFWPVTWNPENIVNSASPGAKPTFIAENYDPNHPGSSGTPTDVKISVDAGTEEYTITYTFEVPEDTASGTAGIAIAYTEAALYSNMGRLQGLGGQGSNQQDDSDNMGTIFAMRTFPAKIKDDTTAFTITWRIIF